MYFIRGSTFSQSSQSSQLPGISIVAVGGVWHYLPSVSDGAYLCATMSIKAVMLLRCRGSGSAVLLDSSRFVNYGSSSVAINQICDEVSGEPDAPSHGLGIYRKISYLVRYRYNGWVAPQCPWLKLQWLRLPWLKLPWLKLQW